MGGTLLRGGSLITLNPELGDIEGGDLLIEDDEIKEIGRNVHAPEAESIDARDFIVMPGFVNAHQHTWQTGIRGVAGDWSLVEYIRQMHEGFGPGFQPEDVYLANLVGALNQLNGGVTTLFDWCHNNPTPEHTDAGLDGSGGGGNSRGLRTWNTQAPGLPRASCRSATGRIPPRRSDACGREGWLRTAASSPWPWPRGGPIFPHSRCACTIFVWPENTICSGARTSEAVFTAKRPTGSGNWSAGGFWVPISTPCTRIS